ncbi:hypothetical protein FRB99_001267 [Tulasnella sp. 403]|nr:hypothetical protein FRB99_001267 [Tulasnella sp. 403]
MAQEAKPLQLPQYESIATSVKVRQALEGNTGLKTLLRKIDSMDGVEREMELERVLGVTGDKAGGLLSDSEAADVESLRLLAEAIEEAVRGKKDDYVGLDWTAGHD